MGTSITWNDLSWVTELPFMEELPGSKGSESSTGATSDNDLMNGLAGLWHFNEQALNSAPSGQ